MRFTSQLPQLAPERSMTSSKTRTSSAHSVREAARSMKSECHPRRWRRTYSAHLMDLPAVDFSPRVLLVAPVAGAGGAGEVALSLARCAADGNYEISVVLLADGPLLARLQRSGTPVELIAAGRLRSPGRFVSTI